MITINYNGKTYIPWNWNSLSMQNIIKYAIADGNLQEKAEEVKENKQTLTLPEMEYKWEREYYRNWIKLEKLKESPSYDEMVSMWMPTELTGCQWVITEHNIGSMGYHQDVENTILRNQEDWKREHGFLSEEDRPEHPKWYLYPETINSYYDTNKTKEWNYQEYQKQLKKAQDEWWAGIKENKEPDTSILEKLKEELKRMRSTNYDLYTLSHINIFLTSLETPQFTPWQEEEWKPKFREVIEVSNNDWEDNWWISATFLHKDSAWYYCTVIRYWEAWYEYFDNARPIEDKIELISVPDFDWDWVMNQLEVSQKINHIPFTALAIMATHIWAMNKHLKLIAKQN